MKKRNRLICVLGALILMNPLSFVFGFHCHFNRSGFYCHRRSACLSRRGSRHVSDSNSTPTSRHGNTIPTTTPVPIVTSTPIPTPIPTQVVYKSLVTPVPVKVKVWHAGDGFFSYGE
jgi:hypothetical protein